MDRLFGVQADPRAPVKRHRGTLWRACSHRCVDPASVEAQIRGQLHRRASRIAIGNLAAPFLYPLCSAKPTLSQRGCGLLRDTIQPEECHPAPTGLRVLHLYQVRNMVGLGKSCHFRGQVRRGSCKGADHEVREGARECQARIRPTNTPKSSPKELRPDQKQQRRGPGLGQAWSA